MSGSNLFEHNITAAKKKVRDEAGAGCTCPVCGQYVKLYKRKMNSQMAHFLCRLYTVTRQTDGEWFHVRDFLDAGHKASSDGTYLRYWHFIEPRDKADAPESDDEKKKQRSMGYWKITDLGKTFAEGRSRAKAHVIILAGKCEGFSEEMIDIREALGAKFDYAELMGRDNEPVVALQGDER